MSLIFQALYRLIRHYKKQQPAQSNMQFFYQSNQQTKMQISDLAQLQIALTLQTFNASQTNHMKPNNLIVLIEGGIGRLMKFVMMKGQIFFKIKCYQTKNRGQVKERLTQIEMTVEEVGQNGRGISILRVVLHSQMHRKLVRIQPFRKFQHHFDYIFRNLVSKSGCWHPFNQKMIETEWQQIDEISFIHLLRNLGGCQDTIKIIFETIHHLLQYFLIQPTFVIQPFTSISFTQHSQSIS